MFNITKVPSWSAGTVFCSLAVLAMLSPRPAAAGSKEFLAGAAAGAVGTIIIQELTKGGSRPAKRQKYRSNGSRNSASSARTTIATFPTTRDDVRVYQANLNALGFDAGTPDGIAGRQTRTAVASFQAAIGSPETGTLSRNDATELRRRSSQPLVSAGPIGTTIENGGAMPTINSVGGAPKPSFPALPLHGTSTASTTQGTQGVSGQFAARSTGSSPAFSAPLGAPPVNKNAASVSGSSPSFPVAGLPEAGTAQSSQPSFPAISSPAGTGAVTNPVSPSMPAVTDQSGGSLATAALTQEIETHGSNSEQAPQFDILGVAIGHTVQSAQSVLAKEGFAVCETNGDVIICEKRNDSLRDRILLGAGPEPDDRIYLVARDLEFSKPLAAGILKDRMSDRYGAILSRPEQVIASPDCRATILSMSVKATSVGLAIVGTDPSSMTDVARVCTNYSGIRFKDEQAGQIRGATITLFSGQMWQQATGSGATAQEKIAEELKF